MRQLFLLFISGGKLMQILYETLFDNFLNRPHL